MSRIYFEDSPSTNTPRNAANLNKLNNVVISSTEPNTGEEVWFQKGNNIDKKIYTKNDNGVYEEFYDENDFFKTSDYNPIAIDTGIYVADNQTKTYNVGNYGTYLYINSHPNYRCFLLISINKSLGVKVDTIFSNGPSAVPTISLSGNVLTITANGPSFAELFKISSLSA